MYNNEDVGVPVCLLGNGQCSPGKENSRMSVDMSTPNGETVSQGPNSPSGEWLINRYTLTWSARTEQNACMQLLFEHTFTSNILYCSLSMLSFS